MRASPNFGPRRGGLRPDLIVLHYTAMTSATAACDWLCNAKAEVSAHYLIDEQGGVIQMVDEAARAWHAGAGSWGAVDDVNSRSIGVELANPARVPFSEPQMHSLEALLGGIMRRWSIPAHRVIGHSDMAPGRKIDPGPKFDWRRLALQGLSIWPGRTGAPEKDFKTAACQFGYPAVDDAVLLDTFRQRFRPWAKGALDPIDLALINDLAQRFPVDGRAPKA